MIGKKNKSSSNSGNHHNNNNSLNGGTQLAKQEERHPLPCVELPVAPDGGWGWVVVLCSFMIHVIADGVTYTFGIFYVEFLKHFHESKGKTAWVASIMVGTTFCIGPIASGLTSKYGCRAVTIAGSLLATFGLVISVVANDVTTLFFTIGLCTGAGFGLMYLPAIVSVTMYFEKKRAFATGIAVCGSGFGTFALAPIIEQLVQYYGWRGAMLCTAGLVLHCCVFGVLLRPLEETSSSRKRMYVPDDGLEINGNAILSQQRDKQPSLPPYSAAISNGSTVFRYPPASKEKQPSLPPYETLPNGNVELEPFSSNLPPNYSLSPNGNMISMSASTIPTLDVMEWRGDVNNDFIVANMVSSDGGNLNAASNQQNESGGKSSPSGKARPLSAHLAPSWGSTPSQDGCILDMGNQNGVEGKTFSCQHIPGAISPPSPTMIVPSKSLLRLRKDIFYSGSIQNLQGSQHYNSSHVDLCRVKRETSTLPRERRRLSHSTLLSSHGAALPDTPAKDGSVCERCCFSAEIKEAVSEMMNFSLLLSPLFLLFAFSNFFTSVGFNVPYVYMADRASLVGVDEKKASYLLSAIGVSNTLGRVVLGYVSDKPWLNRVWLYNFCIAACGIATSFSYLAKNYEGLFIYCLIFGVSSGAFVSLTSVILVDILGLDKLTNAFGLVLFFEGIASVIGPPLTGWLFDWTGSYDPGFFFSGGVITLGGVMLFLIPCFKDKTEGSVSDVKTVEVTAEQQPLADAV